MSNTEVSQGALDDGFHETTPEQKVKGFKRFYSLFFPSSADARNKQRTDNASRKKAIKGLASVNAPAKERFIPISSNAIIEHLNRPEMWNDNEFPAAQNFMENLIAWRHQSYRGRLTRLKNAYLTFSPDRDTVKAIDYTPIQLLQMRHNLMEHLGDLLESANYEKVTQEDLDLLLTSDSPYGLRLHVDLDAFDDVVIYFRGATTKIVEYRDWRWAYLKKKGVETPIFQRLFVALKLKPEEEMIKELMMKEQLTRKKAEKRIRKNKKIMPDEVTSDHIYLKLFKNIPQDDLEMMFPNTKVEFKLFDKLKIGLTAGGGTIAGLAAAIPKLLLVTTAALNPITLLTTLAGIIGLLIRQVTKIFHQRNEYMMTLAQNLYFHNLANNRGVLTLLVDRAEEEDTKEELLLYNFLVRNKDQHKNLKATKDEIEDYLQRQFGVDIAFDMEDGFSRLLRDGIVEKAPDGGYKILPPARAARQLERLWRGVLIKTETV